MDPFPIVTASDQIISYHSAVLVIVDEINGLLSHLMVLWFRLLHNKYLIKSQISQPVES